MRKVLVIVLLAGICSGGAGAVERLWPASAVGKTAAGYVLLDRIQSLFQDLATNGPGSKAKIDPALESIMADAAAAKAKKQIDPVYYRRFDRLMRIMKLTLVMDHSAIFASLTEKEFADFAEDVLGSRQGAIDKDGKPGIGPLAGALAEEIVNLRLYLDTKDQKAKLLEQWTNSFSIGKN
jgi:hypothetical protein